MVLLTGTSSQVDTDVLELLGSDIVSSNNEALGVLIQHLLQELKHTLQNCWLHNDVSKGLCLI